MRLSGALISLLALSVFLTVFAGVSRARGPEGVDLQGEWSIELGGDNPVSCSATILHRPGDTRLDIYIECTGFGPETYTWGLVHPDTHRVQFTATFQPTAPPAQLVRIDGILADDRQSFDGLWFEGYTDDGPQPFMATYVGPITSPLPPLLAPVDLTGTWHIELEGDTFDFNCDVVLQQKGRALDGAANCSVFGWMDIGTQAFDPVTGELRIDAYGWGGNVVQMEGLAADSDSIGGTWLAVGGWTGTFTAERATVDLHDVNGVWDALLPSSGDRCSITFTQDILLLDALVDCGDIGAGNFEGSINPFEGSFSVEGLLDDIEMSIAGRTATDGSNMVGTLRQGFEQSWPIVIVPQGQLERGVLAVDCLPERDGLQNECQGRTDEEQEIAIDLLLAPAELPQRVEFALEYPADLTAYHPSPDPLDEVVPGQCTDLQRTLSEGRATFSCLLPADVEAGPILMLTVSCARAVRVPPWLPFLYLRPTSDQPGPALIDGAILPCFEPEPEPRRISSDANCDGDINSIDVTLLLQHIAGLIDSFDCEVMLDLNFDGQINAIDAAVFLQWIAGLLGPPP